MASVSVDDARYIISKLYSSPIWKDKVKKMPDKQVLAIYFSSCDRGAFDKPKKSKKKEIHKHIEKPRKRVDPVVDDDDYYCEQLAFDL